MDLEKETDISADDGKNKSSSEDEDFHSAESDVEHNTDEGSCDANDEKFDKTKEEKDVPSIYSEKPNLGRREKREFTSEKIVDEGEKNSCTSYRREGITTKPAYIPSSRNTELLPDPHSSSDEDDSEECKIILVEVIQTDTKLTPEDVESEMERRCKISGNLKIKCHDDESNSFLVFFNTAKDALSALSKVRKINGVKVKLSFCYDVTPDMISDEKEEKECKTVLIEVVEKDKHLTCDAVELNLESKRKFGYEIDNVKADNRSNAFLAIFTNSLHAVSSLSKVKSINDVKVKLSLYHDDPALFGKNLPESKSEKESDSSAPAEEEKEKEEEEEGCKAVVIQVLGKMTSDNYLSCDIIELFFANKKAGRCKITESYYDKKLNQYLVIFEKASDAKLAMSLKEIKGIKVSFKPFNGDPDSFSPKEMTIKVAVNDKDIYKAEYLNKKANESNELNDHFKTVRCEYKLLKNNKKNAYFKLSYFYNDENSETKEKVTENANKKLKDLLKTIKMEKINLPHGINISQDIKNMNKDKNVLVTEDEVNSILILSDDKDTIKKYTSELRRAVEMKKKGLEEKKLTVEYAKSPPGKILFFRKFLLTNLQQVDNTTYKFETEGISIKGPAKDVMNMKSKILELLQQIGITDFNLEESNMSSFLSQPSVTDHLNDMLKSEVGECCLVIVDNERPQIVARKQSALLKKAKDLILKEVLCKKISFPDIEILAVDKWIMFVRLLRDEYRTIRLQTNKENKIMTVIGYTADAKAVEKKIQEFINENTLLKKIVVCDDDNKAKYLQMYHPNLISDIKDRASRIDGRQVHITPIQGCSWLISGNEEQMKKIEAELLEACASILVEVMTFDFLGVNSLFQGHESKGKEILSLIMTQNKCIIIEGKKSSTQGRKLEMVSEWSFNSTKIVVMKGDIRLLSVGAIVNAANKNLSHGAGLAKAIVDMGGKSIQNECDEYIKENKALSDGEVMVSGPGYLPCQKVIHAVGPIWNGGKEEEEEKLKMAVKNALTQAVTENLTSIAIPPISTGIFNYPQQSASTTIVQAICSFLNTASPSKLQTIYLCDLKMDMLHMYCKELKKLIGKASTQGELWKTDREEEEGAVGGSGVSYTDVEESNGGHISEEGSDNDTGWICGLGRRSKKNGSSVDPPKSTQIKIKTGELDKIKADVLVNCTSPKLDLKVGAVSRALLHGAGDTLQDECNRKYKDGIKPGEVAVTNAGRLQSSKIYHGTLLSYMGKEKENAKNTLKMFVKKCLEDAASYKMKSICFPALGCGKLNFPADISAHILFNVVQKFLERHSESSLKEVIFLIHPSDKAVLHAYQEVSEEFFADRLYDYESPRRDLSSHSGKCGNIQVEICGGDITKEKSDCIVNICDSSMEMKYGISKIIAEKAGPELRDECFRKKGEFEYDGVAITTAGELQAKVICHVKIQKSSREWISSIKKALYTIMKEDVSTISFPAIGTGGLKIPAWESAKFMHTALKEFSQKKPYSKIEKVRIVIFQSDYIKDFEKVFETKKNRNHDKHAESSERTFKRSNFHKNEPKSPRKKEEVVLTIYAEDKRTIDTIKTKLKKRLKEERSKKSTDDNLDCIVDKLKSHEVDEFERIAKKYNVELEKTSNKKLVFEGLTGNVNEACSEITSLLQKKLNKKHQQQEKGIISAFVDWEYEECPGGKRHSFGPGVTCMLEKSFKNKEAEVKFTDQKKRSYTVDLKKMMEYRGGGSRKPVRVFRINKGEASGGVVKQFKKEEEALKGKDTVYIPIHPSRSYDDTNPEEFHFRLAESQFCRLLGTNAQFCVKLVEYVVNPVLRSTFRAAQDELKKSRGVDDSKPVLAFHGTNESNINPICEKGFLMQGDANFVRATSGKQFYGDGIYFSEYPEYSMGYIRGSCKLLLCKVLLGKPYTCTSLRQTSELEKGYDSHVSADKKELVVFHKDRILPCYIVHYTQQRSDYSYM